MVEQIQQRSTALGRKLVELSGRNADFFLSYEDAPFFDDYSDALNKTVELLMAFTPDRVLDDDQGEIAALGIETALLLMDFGISLSNDRYILDMQGRSDVSNTVPLREKYLDVVTRLSQKISPNPRLSSLVRHDLITTIINFFYMLEPETLGFYDLEAVWGNIRGLIDTLAVLCGFIAGSLDRIQTAYAKHPITIPEARINLNNSAAFLAINTLVLNAVVVQELLSERFQGVTVEIVDQMDFADSIELSHDKTASGHIVKISNYYPMKSHDLILDKMAEYAKGDNGFIHGLENAINLFPVSMRLLPDSDANKTHGIFEIYVQMQPEDLTIVR